MKTTSILALLMTFFVSTVCADKYLGQYSANPYGTGLKIIGEQLKESTRSSDNITD